MQVCKYGSIQVCNKRLKLSCHFLTKHLEWMHKKGNVMHTHTHPLNVARKQIKMAKIGMTLSPKK